MIRQAVDRVVEAFIFVYYGMCITLLLFPIVLLMGAFAVAEWIDHAIYGNDDQAN